MHRGCVVIKNIAVASAPLRALTVARAVVPHPSAVGAWRDPRMFGARTSVRHAAFPVLSRIAIPNLQRAQFTTRYTSRFQKSEFGGPGRVPSAQTWSDRAEILRPSALLQRVDWFGIRVRPYDLNRLAHALAFASNTQLNSSIDTAITVTTAPVLGCAGKRGGESEDRPVEG